PPDAPRVLTSSIGAVGLMQIHPRVWRGLYDIDRLGTDIRYNAAAGAAILEHYLVDYALRRGEHQHDGGADNLVRATYAAYNGGPGQMSRYRRDNTPPRLRAIDRAFWEQFEHIRDHDRPDPASCYPV
ncbi:MAG TPA: lytic transglycosylase domain-containing protein, partial [Xanthomonadaceae bacterium]|nr:lytic transglycosylase domain-containing protein [Xanthomonadaceae bacterium]